MLYQVLRSLQLRRRDTTTLRRIIDEEAATNQTRDAIVESALALLQDDVTRLDTLVTQLGTSPAGTFIRRGQSNFHDLLTKLSVAAKIAR